MTYLKLVLIGCIIILSDVALAQTQYKTGFDTEKEKAGWQEFSFGKTTSSTWEIGIGGTNGSQCLFHFAPTGDADKDSLVNWYVSPKFNFTLGGSLDSLKYIYFSAFNSPLPEQVVQVYLLEGNPDPSASTKNTLLLDLSTKYAGNGTARDTVWSDTGNIAIPIGSSESYIAFKFVAIDGWSSINFDDIHITTLKTNSVGIIPIANFNVYPNPSQGSIQVILDKALQHSDFTFHLFDPTGREVFTQLMDPLSPIKTDLTAGIYYYAIKSDEGQSILQKIILK